VAIPLFSGLTALLTGFGTYVAGSLVARIASLVVFSGVSAALVSSLVSNIQSAFSQASDILFVVEIMGFGEALGIIVGAYVLRSVVRAWSIRPSSAITGRS